MALPSTSIFTRNALFWFILGTASCVRSEAGSTGAAATDESLFTFEAGVFAIQDFATDADKKWLLEHGFLRAPDPSIDAAYPIRASLRETVRDWPAEARKGFLRALMSIDTYDTEYNRAVIARGLGAPLLAPLVPFLTAMPVSEAWSRYASEFRDAQMPAHQIAALRDLTVQAMHPSWPCPHLVAVHINPLMPVLNGAAATTHQGAHLVIGPSPSTQKRDVVLTHELLHVVLFRLWERPDILKALDESKCYFDEVRRKGDTFGYRTWLSYAEEGFVRAASYKVQHVDPWHTKIVSEQLFYDALRTDVSAHGALLTGLGIARQLCRERSYL